MATRKKKPLVAVTSSPVEDASHVPCPIHKKPLKIQHLGAEIFAVCNCDVPGNPYQGKKVFSKLGE